MKKVFFTLAITVVVVGLMFSSCQSSSSKMERAKENMDAATQNVVESNDAFNEALQDSIQQFRDAAAKQTRRYELKIKEFKAKITKEKDKVRIENEKKLAELEQKNNELMTRMDNYKDDHQVKWDKFKVEYTHDMHELGEAFKGLTIKNVK